jgi:hypothetical protein
MNLLKLFSVIALLLLTSCNIVRVVSDYDKETNFDNYTTFAFFKPGIDKAKISDLDKKRILRAIQDNLMAKGMNKNSNPDILVSIFTKESQRVDIYQNNFGGAWGWNPYWGGNFNNNRMISSNIEGSLFIDLIDANTKELIWQGVSHSGIYKGNDIEKREEKIRLIVSKILAQYPPNANNK